MKFCEMPNYIRKGFPNWDFPELFIKPVSQERHARLVHGPLDRASCAEFKFAPSLILCRGVKEASCM